MNPAVSLYASLFRARVNPFRPGIIIRYPCAKVGRDFDRADLLGSVCTKLSRNVRHISRTWLRHLRSNARFRSLVSGFAERTDRLAISS